ncbi:MAG: aminodeoxychorismate/anthranilate synthase component II [Thermoplasmataceae archaeon]
MKVMVIDNHDSFVYNIVDMIRRNGAEAEVFENDDLPDPAYANKFHFLVISPGPGNPLNPEDRGSTLDFISRTEFKRILGICFGHQLLGFHLGSGIYRTDRLYHGEVDTISNLGGGILRGISGDFHAVRYHSLAITPSKNITVDAVSGTDGTIMAFHSKDERIFGIQFHPESHYSEFGENIIREFLFP